MSAGAGVLIPIRYLVNCASVAQQRAKLAGRVAQPSELTAAGFCVNLALGPEDVLHLHRRRLAEHVAAEMVAAVGCTHVVGDDPLCPTSGRTGPPFANFWRYHPTFAWGDYVRHSPLVVFPDHLTRLQERVACELTYNPLVRSVTALVTVPRTVLDASASWEAFSQKVDAALLHGWGEGYGVEAVVAAANSYVTLPTPPRISRMRGRWSPCPPTLLPLHFALGDVRQMRLPLPSTRWATFPPWPSSRQKTGQVSPGSCWRSTWCSVPAGVRRTCGPLAAKC